MVRITNSPELQAELLNLMHAGLDNSQIQSYLLEKGMNLSKVTIWKFRKRFYESFKYKEDKIELKLNTLETFVLTYYKAMKIVMWKVTQLNGKLELGVELSPREYDFLLKAMKTLAKIQPAYENKWNIEKDLWEYEKLRERYVKQGN